MQSKKLFVVFLICGLILLAGYLLASGAIPHLINYQGKLTDHMGDPVANGTYNLCFKIYGSESGTDSLWWECHLNVQVNNGIFSVILGSVNPINLSFDSQYWLEVMVGAETIAPRRQLTSVGYSFRAQKADTAEHVINGGTVSDTAKYAWNADSLDGHNWGDTYPNSDKWNNHNWGYIYPNADKVDGYDYSSTWPTNLANVKSACSNDFHNIGGTDDDSPDNDGEVPDNISINNGRLYAPSGSGNVGIGTTSLASKLTVQGDIRTNTSGGAASTKIFTSSNTGIIESYGPNGNRNARLTFLSGYNDNGYVAVSNSSGQDRAGLYVNETGGGQMHALGPNGNTNTYLGYLTSYPNNGYVGILDASGNWQAGMYVNSSGLGIVWGDEKNFRIPNPNQPGTDIWYCSLEGPEAAAYVRGTGHLVSGRAEVTLPDHFVAVASSRGITVQLTPLSAESKGLAVVKKSPEMFAIQELGSGDGTYDFDFMVMAVRKGHEDYRVIRPASEAKPAEIGLSAEQEVQKQ